MATKKGKQRNVRKPYETPFFHLDQVMVIPYLKQCRVCRHDSPKNMLCTNCKGSYYCSKRCQQKDWQSHKTLCKQIRTALDKCAKEEDNLHHYDEYEDGSTIMDYFDPKHGIVG